MTDVRELYGESEPIPANKLGEVASLANQQMELEGEVHELEESLKRKKAELREISEKELPELMESLGLELFVTSEGAKIAIKENFYASIAAARRDKAAKWLIDNHQDALVKRDVHLPFAAGDADAVRTLQEILNDHGYTNYSVDFKMHTGAVKSVLKELITDGVDVPFDLFGLRRVIEAKISL